MRRRRGLLSAESIRRRLSGTASCVTLARSLVENAASIANMKFIDFDFLLERMVGLEQAAFLEFEEAMRDRIVGWLREIGLSEEEVVTETPRCLLGLGILAVQRRREIKSGRFLVWCR